MVRLVSAKPPPPLQASLRRFAASYAILSPRGRGSVRPPLPSPCRGGDRLAYSFPSPSRGEGQPAKPAGRGDGPARRPNTKTPLPTVILAEAGFSFGPRRFGRVHLRPFSESPAPGRRRAGSRCGGLRGSVGSAAISGSVAATPSIRAKRAFGHALPAPARGASPRPGRSRATSCSPPRRCASAAHRCGRARSAHRRPPPLRPATAFTSARASGTSIVVPSANIEKSASSTRSIRTPSGTRLTRTCRATLAAPPCSSRARIDRRSVSAFSSRARTTAPAIDPAALARGRRWRRAGW